MGNNAGYLLLWRKLRENPLWTEQRKFSRAEAWLDILMEARWEKEPTVAHIAGEDIRCERGQSLNSLETWATRWGWSKGAIQRFFKMLEKRYAIRTESVRVTTRLTVLNYERYQDARYAKSTATDTAADTCPIRQPIPEERINEKADESSHQQESACADSSVVASPEKRKPKRHSGNGVGWSVASKWTGITDDLRRQWAEAYPACDIERQLAAMTAWLTANPKKAHKSNWVRFIVNWLARQQDKGGDENTLFVNQQPPTDRRVFKAPAEYLETAPRMGQKNGSD